MRVRQHLYNHEKCIWPGTRVTRIKNLFINNLCGSGTYKYFDMSDDNISN